MTVYENINALVGYALTTGLIQEDDIVYTKNRLLEVLRLDGFETQPQAEDVPKNIHTEDLEQILAGLLDYAGGAGIFTDDGIVNRDLFDTKLMGCLVARPSEVQKKFMELYKKSPKEATDWYYKFSQDTDYIRRYRLCRDVKWKTRTDYGELDITINLSKPEKDPKAIAAARNAPATGYPACLLCKENVGYSGRINHPARQNHRIIPLRLNGKEWGLQYSPYGYYNEHCIVFSGTHAPMKIDKETFKNLFDFIKLFPHYTIGSNADLPIVGGSILTHNHYQGGCYEFPMAKAPIETGFTVRGFEDINCGILKWPMSVIRLNSSSSERIVELADKILRNWRIYTDEKSFIYSQTGGEDHNTITPIARMHSGNFELDLVLRNNITTSDHPMGVFHPHAELHHIKKENIGLIEVMGLAVLPARLRKELSDLGTALVQGRDFSQDPDLGKHYQWVQNFISRHPKITASNVGAILKEETGLVFAKVLEDSGVYKRTPEGKAAFMKFVKTIC